MQTLADLSVLTTKKPLTSTLKLIYEFKLIKSVLFECYSNIFTLSFCQFLEEGINPGKFLVILVAVPSSYFYAVCGLPSEVFTQVIHYYRFLKWTAKPTKIFYKYRLRGVIVD